MRYKSCHLLEHGISIEKYEIKNCCLAKPTNDLTPVVLENYDPANLDWEKLVENKKQQRKAQQISQIEECKGCYVSEDEDWDDDDYISYINFNHWMKCNSNCIYCYTQYTNDKSSNNIYPAILDLINKNLFRNTGEITFQGGEPTVLEEFNDLVNLFLDQRAKIRVHSSGILYSKAIERGLKEGLLTVVISPDSGDKETYEKVKRVPCFEKVWENVKKYSQNIDENNKHLIKVKYILIPGINDSLKSINNWFRKVKESNINQVILDIEFLYQKNNLIMPNYMYLLIDYIKQKAKKLNLTYSLYDSAIHAEKSKVSIKHKWLLKNEILLNAYVNFQRFLNQDKNMKYNGQEN